MTKKAAENNDPQAEKPVNAAEQSPANDTGNQSPGEGGSNTGAPENSGNKLPPADDGEKQTPGDGDGNPGASENKTDETDGQPPADKVGEKTSPQIELKTVSLRGWDTAKVGTHSAHLGNGIIVNFRDGVSEVSEEIEAELRESGLIE